MADKRQNPSVSPPAASRPRAAAMGTVTAAVGHTLSDPFRLVLTLAVNLAIVAGVVGTAVILRNHKPPPKPPTMQAALSALDRGDTNEARNLALQLAAKRIIANEEEGVPDYIFGRLPPRALTPRRQEPDWEVSSGGALLAAFARAGFSGSPRGNRTLSAGQEPLPLRPIGRCVARIGRGPARSGRP